jgi:asparagine synthetase B (glutamine-hydrolysing)
LKSCIINWYFKKLIDETNKEIRKIELILRSRKRKVELADNLYFVYIMSNQAYPNIYKIGWTSSLPEERAEELTGTGHLHPFKVEFSKKFNNAEQIEQQCHDYFKKNRVANNREFFEVPLNEIKDYNQTSNYLNSYKNCDELDLKNKLMFADFQNYLLNDHLRKIDRSSMLNSVEARNPFLDYRIVNFAYSLDSKMKVNFFNLKIILKNIAKKYLDNKNINSQKLGLTPPINYWIRYYF